MSAQSFPVLIDPGREPWPRANQRLMGDLDAVSPGRQQACFDEQIDHLALDRRSFDLCVDTLRRAYSDPLRPRQSEEQLLGLTRWSGWRLS